LEWSRSSFPFFRSVVCWRFPRPFIFLNVPVADAFLTPAFLAGFEKFFFSCLFPLVFYLIFPGTWTVPFFCGVKILTVLFVLPPEPRDSFFFSSCPTVVLDPPFAGLRGPAPESLFHPPIPNFTFRRGWPFLFSDERRSPLFGNLEVSLPPPELCKLWASLSFPGVLVEIRINSLFQLPIPPFVIVLASHWVFTGFLTFSSLEGCIPISLPLFPPGGDDLSLPHHPPFLQPHDSNPLSRLSGHQRFPFRLLFRLPRPLT